MLSAAEIKVMWKYYLTSFLIGLSTLTGAYMYLYFKNNIGMSYSMINFTIMIFLIVDIVFELPTGVFGDGFSRKKQAIIGTVIMFLSCLGLYAAGTYIGIIVSYSVMGIGWAFFFGAREAWVVDQLNRSGKAKYITKYYANSQFFFMIGAILGPLTISFIVSESNLKIIWLIDAIITISTIIPMLIEKETFSKRGRFSKIFSNSLTHFLSNKKLLLIGLTYFISSFYLGSIAGQQPFLIFLGAPLFALGVKESLSSTFRALSLAFLNVLKTKMFVVLASIIQFLIMIPLIFLARGQWSLALIILIIPSLFAFIDPIVFNFQNTQIPSKLRSSTLSMLGMCASVGAILGFLLGGYSLDTIGPAWTIVIFSLPFLLSSVIYAKLLPISLTSD